MKSKKTFFETSVISVVAKIPRGTVMTYREVAEAVGRPRSFRAVGSLMKKNRDPEIPCFRVVRSDGRPGEYNRGVRKKEMLLREEGSLDTRGRIRRYFSKGKNISRDQCIERLRSGGIGVLPTDTIYGLVGCALNQSAVERVYRVRKRNPEKPCIILISSEKELALFGIRLNTFETRVAQSVWPGPVSIILPCQEKKLSYLHREMFSLAFRVPDDGDVLGILKKTGPLLAPSANFEGQPAAETCEDAKKIFGKTVDFYADGGRLCGLFSTLIAVSKDDIVLKREGKVSFGKIVKSVKGEY